MSCNSRLQHITYLDITFDRPSGSPSNSRHLAAHLTYPCSFLFLTSTTTHSSSSPRAQLTTSLCLPAIPSRSLSLRLPVPDLSSCDSIRPRLTAPTALQYITSIIITVSPDFILRCLTSPLPHLPLSYSSCQRIHPSNHPSSASGSTIPRNHRHHRLLPSDHPASKHNSCAHRLEAALKYSNRPRSTLESTHQGGLGASKETE
jgi:hypothetical protein